ncbi:hypothetical protein THIOM_001570 [Candidatus Thiomargarita nelsonii]|uniref:Uncharacterized protein n=1 Tax=Candidatus Thiomargarita nelsonii TaxID=1003181 RepID=A0A176S3V0_9GAMM|nr:hypothetical protein THIOM_001570 [Candidatus Thiomargarita nelsonii]
MMGKYFINSPTMPGQNNKGKNTAKVVAVAPIMGQNIRLAAIAYASVRGIPSLILRSANSVTMIAPSISIPEAKIKLNNTTIFMVSPI